MWEELVGLFLECVLPMAVVLSLSSQSLSVPHPVINSGPPRVDIMNWMLQNPSGSGWLFLSIQGASHIYLTIPSVT